MDRTESLKRPESVFAPLVGRHVQCPRLEVARCNGKKLDPALDAYGQPIELHPDDDIHALVSRISASGRYPRHRARARR